MGKNEFHRLCINNICIAFLTKKRTGDLRETRLSNLHLLKTRTEKVYLYLFPHIYRHLQVPGSSPQLSRLRQADLTSFIQSRCTWAEMPFCFLSFPCFPTSPSSSTFHTQYATHRSQTCCGKRRIDVRGHETALCDGELTSRLRLCGDISMAHTNTLLSFNTQPLKPEATPEHKSRLLLLLCTTRTSYCSHSLLQINNFSTQRVTKGRRKRWDLSQAQTLQSVAGNQLQQVYLS